MIRHLSGEICPVHRMDWGQHNRGSKTHYFIAVRQQEYPSLPGHPMSTPSPNTVYEPAYLSICSLVWIFQPFSAFPPDPADLVTLNHLSHLASQHVRGINSWLSEHGVKHKEKVNMQCDDTQGPRMRTTAGCPLQWNGLILKFLSWICSCDNSRGCR